MIENGQKFLFNAFLSFLWVVLVAFLSNGKVTKGTRFDVFNQFPSKERYLPNYELYHNLSKLNDCIYHLVARYPSILDVEMQFRSRWGLSQYVLHFANLSLSSTSTEKKSQPADKVKILLTFGEHSSEYLPVESMIYLVQNLTAGMDEPEGSYAYNYTMFVLNNIDLFVIGLVNPDGRAIVEKTKNFCWKDTGSGAELNKHGKYYSIVSTGRQVIVEPECKVLRELTKLIDFDVAISFHSGDEEILIPRRGTKNLVSNGIYPNDGEVLVLASILSSSSPKHLQYKFFNKSQIHYGDSIFSYIAITKKIPFTYVVSLWKNKHYRIVNQQCFVNANPRSHQLKKVVQSFHPIYTNLFKHVVHWKQSKKVSLAMKRELSNVSVMVPSSFYLLIMYLLLVFFIVLFLFRVVQVPLSWRLFYRRQRRIVSLRSLSSAFSLFVI